MSQFSPYVRHRAFDFNSVGNPHTATLFTTTGRCFIVVEETGNNIPSSGFIAVRSPTVGGTQVFWSDNGAGQPLIVPSGSPIQVFYNAFSGTVNLRVHIFELE